MRGYDAIRELYYGNISPNEQGYRTESVFGVAIEALSTHEAWLKERLDPDAKKRFEELMSCHSTIVDTMAHESFRAGFRIGVMLIMDAVSESGGSLYDF